MNYKEALNLTKIRKSNKRTFEKNWHVIISDGFHMAKVLNEYSSSVFITEDISSLPVPVIIFDGDKSVIWGSYL